MQTIYIVEDDRNIREIEMLALKNSGYRVQGFGTAKEFYAALTDKLPTLVMLDIMLPDEDGITILQNLRRRSDTKKLPVILVTAKGEEIDKVRGFDCGADDYIAKPFGVMEMIARILASAVLVPFLGYAAICMAHPMAWIFADIFLIPAFFWCRQQIGKKRCM